MPVRWVVWSICRMQQGSARAACNPFVCAMCISVYKVHVAPQALTRTPAVSCVLYFPTMAGMLLVATAAR
jgi:hypothetical protein